MIHLYERVFLVSGEKNSANIVKILADREMQVIQNLDTQGKRVYAACLLHADQPGISMPRGARNGYKKLILGCEDGFVMKFERKRTVLWERADTR